MLFSYRAVFFIISVLMAEDQAAADFLRVCYFPGWAYNRASEFARFGVANVEADACTHLIYAFGNIDRINKVLQTPDSGEESRYSFANNSVVFLRKYGFDGLDIDWEYPNSNTNENFVRLLKSLRSVFNQETTSSRLLITVATPAGKTNIDQGFNVSEMNRYVDYVSIMTYDFVGAGYSEVTNFNSPLYSRNDPAFNQEYSTNWTVKYYESLGLFPNKTLFGVTGTGKWLVLKNASISVPGSPTVKVSLRNSSDYQIIGGMAYTEICKLMLSNTTTRRVFDDQQKAMYLVNEDNWITYEDTDTITEKTKWAVKSGLAGLMFWALDQDDFSGKACNNGTFPLMKAVKLITDPLQTSTLTPQSVTTKQDTTPSQSVTTEHDIPSLGAATQAAADFLRVCYFPGWAYNRASEFARFGVANVEADACTHLIYAFGNIDRINKVLHTPDSGEETRYRLFTALRSKNPQLKTLLSIGGENDHGEGFVAVSQTDALATSFANNSVVFLRKYGFDGLDIDWEYPNSNTNENFVRLLKSLRSVFNQETTSSRLLITVAAPAGKTNIDQGFNVSEMNRYVDYVSIMTYDFVGAGYSEVTNFNSPLYSRNDPAFNQEYSTNWTVKYYESLGLFPNKTLFGVTGTGKWLVLKNASITVPGSPTVKGSLRNSSDYQIIGGMAYTEICKVMLSNTTTRRVFDDQQKANYLVSEDNWITYEDTETITEKTKWALKSGLAGVMFWALDQDDFSGKACNNGTFPLMKAVKLITDSVRTSTATPQSVTTVTIKNDIPHSPSVTIKHDPTLGTSTHNSAGYFIITMFICTLVCL
ncbi:hypothetical protein Btru_047194 [Bulinus truncatus]|nr:hypothetical protein Btru_047194 [Bulinus truncatus]